MYGVVHTFFPDILSLLSTCGNMGEFFSNLDKFILFWLSISFKSMIFYSIV